MAQVETSDPSITQEVTQKHTKSLFLITLRLGCFLDEARLENPDKSYLG